MWKLHFCTRWHTSKWIFFLKKYHQSQLSKMGQPCDLECSMRYFLAFGKIIGLYPSKIWIAKLVPFILAGVAIIDWIGYLVHPVPSRYRKASDIFGAVGSAQFYSLGTFWYHLYLQQNHQI
ncbi:unnamed protein product [Orchesella dallaii]|uniref:Uncharacterized protein n=1 Tax=Orchesella dallaii TaxID=48710 RepID=A0ABP1PLT5_9HEXA